MRLVEHEASAVLDHRLRRLFGSKTGLINDIRHIPPDRGHPDVVVATPTLASVGRLYGDGTDLDLGVAGKGRSVRSAYLRALGEGIERYCLCWPDREKIVRTTYAELADTDGVTVPEWRTLDVYGDRSGDGTLAPFDQASTVPWTRGTDLLSGEDVTLPAELVWLRTGVLSDEPVHFPGSSNGVATGQSTTTALVRALLELIERDAFMRVWCRQQSPPSVDIEQFPAVDTFVSEVFTDAGPDVEVLALETPLDIPVVATVATDFPDGSSFLVSASAALDPTDAMLDSLHEIGQGVGHLYELGLEYDAEDIDVSTVVDDLERNVAYYAAPANFDEVAFLLEGEKAVPDPFSDASTPESDRATLARLYEQFTAFDATPIAVDVTTPDIREVGLCVTRVVAPSLVPLSPPACLPWAHPAFDGERVTDKPHPFP